VSLIGQYFYWDELKNSLIVVVEWLLTLIPLDLEVDLVVLQEDGFQRRLYFHVIPFELDRVGILGFHFLPQHLA
jgi:hypothetical protein